MPPFPPSSKVVRDLILFVAGIAGIAWQTVVSDADRPALLALFAGMVGLPTYLATKKKGEEP